MNTIQLKQNSFEQIRYSREYARLDPWEKAKVKKVTMPMLLEAIDRAESRYCRSLVRAKYIPEEFLIFDIDSMWACESDREEVLDRGWRLHHLHRYLLKGKWPGTNKSK